MEKLDIKEVKDLLDEKVSQSLEELQMYEALRKIVKYAEDQERIQRFKPLISKEEYQLGSKRMKEAKENNSQ